MHIRPLYLRAVTCALVVSFEAGLPWPHTEMFSRDRNSENTWTEMMSILDSADAGPECIETESGEPEP